MRDGFCPKCAAKLDIGLLDEVYSCTRCEFSIGREKFERIAFGVGRKAIGLEEDNLSLLNNLGHDIVTEDFGDSPFKV